MLGLVAPHDHGEERRLLLPPARHRHPEHGPGDATLGVADLGVVGEVAGEVDAGFGHGAALLGLSGRAVCPALGPGGRWTPWHAERAPGASGGANEVGHAIRSPAIGRLGCRVGWWGACGWGSGMPAPSGQIPPPWARWENEAPTARAACRLVSGRLFGLFQDPPEIVGAAVDDRDGDDAGHLVRMLLFGSLDDLREKAAPGAERDSALGLVVDLALPAVDGADRLEVVPGGAESIDYELAGELHQPVRVWRGDDDLAHVIGWGRHAAPSARRQALGPRLRSWPCCSIR